MDTSMVEGWALLAFGLLKDMWRADKVSCPTSCSMDTPMTDCKCVCSFLGDTDIINMANKTAANIEANSLLYNIDSAIFPGPYTVTENGTDAAVLVLRTLCNDFEELNPQIGEMLQSSAAADIAFWPTHPAVDKALHWKRITGIENYNWTGHGMVTTTCHGHQETDVLWWKNIFDD